MPDSRVLTGVNFAKEVLAYHTGYTVVLLYTTEVISIQQRHIVFQYNLAAKLLKGTGVTLFTYDTNVNGFPSAIKFEQSPPEDLDGTYDGSDELF